MAKQEFATQAPAPFVGDFLQEGIFPFLQSFLQGQLGDQFGQADTSPFTYTGQRVADFDPREEYAKLLSDASVGSYQPLLDQQSGLLNLGALEAGAGTTRAQDLLDQGAGTFRRAEDLGLASLGAFDPNAIGAYYNPFEDAVVDQTIQDITEGFQKADIGTRADAISKGAFGGSRGRLASEELADRFAEEATKRVGAIRERGFTGARDASRQDFADLMRRTGGIAGLTGNIGRELGTLGSRFAGTGTNLANIYGGIGRQFGAMAPTLQNLQTADVNRLMGIGGLDRARDQSLLDLAYQNFVGQYNLPLQTLQNVGAITATLGPLAGGFGYSGEEMPFASDSGAGGMEAFYPNTGPIPQQTRPATPNTGDERTMVGTPGTPPPNVPINIPNLPFDSFDEGAPGRGYG